MPKLGEAFRVWQSETLFPGHNSKIGVSQIMCVLMLEGLVTFTQELRFMSYNFSYQYFQLVYKSTLGLSWLLWPIVKFTYQGTESLTWLKSEAQIVYQYLKGLFAFKGQAQIVFYLKPHAQSTCRSVWHNWCQCSHVGKSDWFWGVTGTSASARISSKVSLFMVGGPFKSGTWLVLEAAPHDTFAAPGR